MDFLLPNINTEFVKLNSKKVLTNFLVKSFRAIERIKTPNNSINYISTKAFFSIIY